MRTREARTFAKITLKTRAGGTEIIYATDGLDDYRGITPDVTGSTRWENRLKAGFSISQDIKPGINGVPTTSTSSVTLFNNDQRYNDLLSKDVSWVNKEIKIWFDTDGVVELVYTGLTTNVSLTASNATITVSLKNALEGLNAPALRGEAYEDLHFNKTEWPDLDFEKIGKPIPYIVAPFSPFVEKEYLGKKIAPNLGTEISMRPTHESMLPGAIIDYSGLYNSLTNRDNSICIIPASAESPTVPNATVAFTQTSKVGSIYTGTVSESNVHNCFAGQDVSDGGVNTVGLGTFMIVAVDYINFTVTLHNSLTPATITSFLINGQAGLVLTKAKGKVSATTNSGMVEEDSVGGTYRHYQNRYNTTNTLTGGSKYVQCEFEARTYDLFDAGAQAESSIHFYSCNITANPLLIVSVRSADTYFSYDPINIQNNFIIPDMGVIKPGEHAETLLNDAGISTLSSTFTDIDTDVNEPVYDVQRTYGIKYRTKVEEIVNSVFGYLKVNEDNEVEMHLIPDTVTSTDVDYTTDDIGPVRSEINNRDVYSTLSVKNVEYDGVESLSAAANKSITTAATTTLHGVTRTKELNHNLEQMLRATELAAFLAEPQHYHSFDVMNPDKFTVVGDFASVTGLLPGSDTESTIEGLVVSTRRDANKMSVTILEIS